MNGQGPWWAALTVWGVVNAVNLLQSAGFLSRVATRSTSTNHAIGYAIMLLAVPATVALVAYVRSGAGWRLWLGPAVFDAFVLFMLVVDYVRPIEFRSPAMPAVLVPYLVCSSAASSSWACRCSAWTCDSGPSQSSPR